jgi:hypothetical protein
MMNDLSKRLRDLADKFSEGWHDGIKIDATDIELLADAAAALAEPEQSEPSPFGWVKSSEMETSRRFGGSINLWREKYDCDVPVYLAAPPRREPLTEQVKNGDWLDTTRPKYGIGGKE